MKPYIALGDLPRHSKAVIVDMMNKCPSFLDFIVDMMNECPSFLDFIVDMINKYPSFLDFIVDMMNKYPSLLDCQYGTFKIHRNDRLI